MSGHEGAEEHSPLGDTLEHVRELLENAPYGTFPRGVQELANGWAVYKDEHFDPLQCTAFFTLPGSALASKSLQAALYFIAVLYIFLGIIIMADTFMGSIEVIVATKYRREKKMPDGSVIPYTVRMINPTIANVSLMALGTSLPELVLMVIGVVSTLNSKPDELAPATIVGTAAYNISIITAVCLAAVPAAPVKKIIRFDVYVMTLIWSLGAYIWVYIVLVVSTPDVIEVWEAIVTFLLFLVFLIFAYAQDVKWRWCRPGTHKLVLEEDDKPAHGHGKPSKVKPNNPSKEPAPAATADEKKAHVPEVRIAPALALGGRRSSRSLEEVSHSPIARAMESAELMQQLARAKDARNVGMLEGDVNEAERIRDVPLYGGIGRLIGGQRFENASVERSTFTAMVHGGAGGDGAGLQRARALTFSGNLMGQAGAQAFNEPKRRRKSDLTSQMREIQEFIQEGKLVVDFSSARYEVPREAATATATIVRFGAIEQSCRVKWALDPRAVAQSGLKVTPESGEVIIEPHELSCAVHLTLDGQSADGAQVDLALAILEVKSIGRIKAITGECSNSLISVLGADGSHAAAPMSTAAQQVGVHFHSPNVFCSWSVGKLRLEVDRTEQLDHALDVRVTVAEGGSALTDLDLVEPPARLSFARFDATSFVEIEILNLSSMPKPQKSFTIQLHSTAPGEEPVLLSACVVTCVDENAFKEKVSKSISRLRNDLAKVLQGNEDCVDKFRDALQLHGGIDEDTGEELQPTAFDMVMHFATVFWKVQLACAPPKEWGSGWPAFFVSMGVIILWTVIMFYLALIFGCAAGMSPAAIGFAFLSGGTSLPDTFASRIAIQHSDRADEAIGNIVGSNAVNVFLGLGLPWVIGAVYHNYLPGGKGIYSVPAGPISLAVILFVILNVICSGVLLIRRWTFGGEIGGPLWASRIFIVWLFLSWIVFVVLCIINEEGQINIDLRR